MSHEPAGGRGLVPYVPPTAKVAEFTPRAVALGALLSLGFGMVTAYLGLRVGLTVSASIPSAVISMAVFRGIVRRGTILENNVTHTIASTGESLAAGIIFTLPALVFLGSPPSTLEIFAIGAAAGFLGILLMIPLRRSLTIDRHAELPFPEGTACALVLQAGDRGGATARPVLAGIALGGLWAFLARGLGLWRETVFWSVPAFHKASIGFELSPVFLGVGYLVGLRIAAVMFAGGVLGWGILLPLFDAFGGAGGFFAFTADTAALTPREVWSQSVRFVGAGAVGAGGLVSVVRAFPAMRESLRHLRAGIGSGARRSELRTERDLPAGMVIGGIVVLGLALWLLPIFDLGALGTVCALVFAFVFVVVSAEMVGLLGTTSQPVSGMTITALLVTTFVLLSAGYSGESGAVVAIRAAAVVCIAIALSGDTSQDLKTGALLGATPRSIQIGQLIGVVSAAIRAGWVLFLLHQAYGLGSELLPAPQAKLMATLVSGAMNGDLPWRLLAFGAGIALAVECLGVRSLPFAIGLYLPIATTAALLGGGIVAAVTQRPKPAEPVSAPEGSDLRTLFAAGLVAGDALIGIVLAALVVSGIADGLMLRTAGSGWLEDIASIVPYALLVALFLGVPRWTLRRDQGTGDAADRR